MSCAAPRYVLGAPEDDEDARALHLQRERSTPCSRPPLRSPALRCALAPAPHLGSRPITLQPGKSTFTTVREFVENSLDAAEDIRVLPTITVRM